MFWNLLVAARLRACGKSRAFEMRGVEFTVFKWRTKEISE